VTGCIVIRPGDAATGATGLDYFVGVSRETTGSTRLCLQLVRIPAGARSTAHLHADHDTAVYVLEGEVVTWYGDRLEEHAVSNAGDFVFIPAGLPHLPVNYGAGEAVAVIARTDPHAQESVVALPELDRLPHLDSRPPS
jgi:uncharacterized RmlC-like cupin family protein